MRIFSWIVACLLLFVAGSVFGIYLDATFGPSQILLQAQPNTKVNLKPKGGDVLEWIGADGKPLPVKFSQGGDFFPCEEPQEQDGNSTCTLKYPKKATSFTYTCEGCFDPTLGPVSGRSPGGHNYIGGYVAKLDDIFVKVEVPPVTRGGGGMEPTGYRPPTFTGLPVDASVSCGADKNVIVFQGGTQVTTITVNPGDFLQLTGFSDLVPTPPNPLPVASGQPLCSQGSLNFNHACVIGSSGTYNLKISASECTGAWDHTVTVVVPAKTGSSTF